jgi:hypothetical protein
VIFQIDGAAILTPLLLRKCSLTCAFLPITGLYNYFKNCLVFITLQPQKVATH